MSLAHTLATIGGFAAAPFTLGTSLLPALAIGGGSAVGGYLAGRGHGGGTADASKQPEAPFLQQLGDQSKQAGQTADSLSGMSTEALAPALQYFSKLLGDNPTAILDATRQERGRVIDQYDTARRAMEQFGPRGGGSTSALAESRFSQAESLADITSTARRDAAAGAAQLGTQLAGLGLSAQQLESMDLGAVISAVLNREGLNVQKRGQNLQAAGGVGEALGSLLGLYLTRKGGPWERAGA